MGSFTFRIASVAFSCFGLSPEDNRILNNCDRALQFGRRVYVCIFCMQLHGVYLSVHRMVISRCAPWSEFLNQNSFQRPGSGGVAADRIERNLRYFSVNYFCICCFLGIFLALLNPIVLLIGALCGSLCAFASLKGETVRVSDLSGYGPPYAALMCRAQRAWSLTVG